MEQAWLCLGGAWCKYPDIDQLQKEFEGENAQECYSIVLRYKKEIDLDVVDLILKGEKSEYENEHFCLKIDLHAGMIEQGMKLVNSA